MAHTEQDYRDAASALPSEYLGGAFIATALSSAEVSAIQIKARFEDNATQMGLLGGSVGEGVQKRGIALAKSITNAQAAKDRKEKTATDDIVFLDLLARIENLNKELVQVRQEIKTLDEELRAEYGDDYLKDMANMYLSDSERESLEGLSPEERDEQIKEMLSDKMLNDDGSIKDAYKHLKIAKVLAWEKKEQSLKTRKKALEKALESGDPEVARDALGNDELSDDAAHGARKDLASQFKSSANGQEQNALKAKEEQLAQAQESRDVEQNAEPNTAIAGFDAFGNG